MAINVGTTVQMVRQVEARIAEIKKAQIAPLEQFAEELRNQLLEFLNMTGQRNAKTEFGTAYVADKESITVEDQSEFKRHVIGTEAWSLIDWRANKTGGKEFEKTEQALPPGIRKTVIREVRVLAPERKKTATNLKVVGSDTVPEEGAPLNQEAYGFDDFEEVDTPSQAYSRARGKNVDYDDPA